MSSELVEIRYGNGQIYLQEPYKNGELHGNRKYWYEDGQLWIYEFYADGVLDGERKIWYKNGRCQSWGFIKNYEYEYKSWHENGTPHKRYFYKNGFLIGEYKTWYEDGSINEYTFYHPPYKNLNWNRKYSHVFLNIRTRLYSRHLFSEFNTFIISDLVKFSNIV
jgi:antitoxin component YwqK of YwqJK toxin-antitoxin module